MPTGIIMTRGKAEYFFCGFSNIAVPSKFEARITGKYVFVYFLTNELTKLSRGTPFANKRFRHYSERYEVDKDVES